MASKMTVRFDDREYRFSHGKAPRGYGSWAFQVDGTIHWAPAPSTLAAAKVWMKNHLKTLAPADFRGAVTVEVCT